jgi:hypothetical protein
MTLNIAAMVTPQYIKAMYPLYLDGDVDENSINSSILITQTRETQAVLGYDLYNKYINDINTYGQPQGAQYIYLFNNYIIDSLCLYTIARLLKPLSLRATNKGVVQKTSEHSTPSILKDIISIIGDIITDAQYSDARIFEYISNFPSDFPEYYTYTGINRIRPKVNTYKAGLYLSDKIPMNGNNTNNRKCCGQGYSTLSW